MSISGLVITLSAHLDVAQWARMCLAADGRLTLGQQTGRSLPAVLEAASDEQAEQICRELGEIPGVEKVDLIFLQLATQDLEPAA